METMTCPAHPDKLLYRKSVGGVVFFRTRVAVRSLITNRVVLVRMAGVGIPDMCGSQPRHERSPPISNELYPRPVRRIVVRHKQCSLIFA